MAASNSPATGVSALGATALTETVVPFQARDGFGLNLLHVTGPAEPTRGPVLLVHGAGVRANIFRAPVQQSIVDVLVANGYDVWLENWRASIDFEPNQWTLDQVARNDHPAAVERIVAETGADSIQAIIHCQGSTSFMLSAVSGLVPQVRTVISNAVSLHPIVPRLARAKLKLLLQFAAPAYPYLDAQWGRNAPSLRAKLVTSWVRLTHHECDNLVCRLSSFIYGIGFPTLWEHENLNEETHAWLANEFAHVPQTFFGQISRSISDGRLLPDAPDATIPADIASREPQTDARFSFVSGELNRCFVPKSQQQTFEQFNAYAPDRHSLHVIPGYAHLDIFMGQHASRDVFPLLLSELERD